ncbi:polysaccharide lyase 6 family protein [Kibdelosporangium philippinense]|uniref:Polysaccharide lyase 6 family protein n=1 Tax=Kibdelosporangium philippinense TaxID=211113 RepID=A0ABS8ZYQ0_9PSEU|nr:polysaccharide lyase 6 family protein [Kibdelosporangium philippinense]MCE7011853.1 polysaccharide lyase 6 family protein [Kibdelosporangium philippinense]
MRHSVVSFFGPVFLTLLAGLTVFPGEAAAATIRVTSLTALQNALNSANPGDRIELADGSYNATSAIQIRRSGTSSAPVTVTAANTGRAEIRGSTGFLFAGGVNNVVLQGFNLRHGGSLSVPSDAHHIRLTRNTVQLSGGGNWVTINGNDVEVDRNTFQNRSTEGVFLQIAGPSTDVAKRTRIHHNYFYNHTFSGANGGESIRLGYSHKQSYSANAVVEYNLFERANGDPEAISVKASDNIVRYNTIRDSRGFIVLRHGHRTTVEGNVIFGNSGIRFHGNDHRIINNYVAASGGRAIVFGSGSEADSGPTSTGHDRPDRVTVAYNTVLGTSAVIDSDGGAFSPKDCVVANNIIIGTGGTLVDMVSGSTVRYEGNIAWGGSAGMPNGYRSVDPRLVRDSHGISRLAAGSPAIDTSSGTYSYVTSDIDLQTRSGRFDVGADELGGSRKPLTTADVGPTS